MTIVMVYILPMLLGRSYDMKTDQVGVDIFPMADLDPKNGKLEKIDRYFTDAQYKLVEDSREARDFLDVSGELSLKIKSGKVNIAGMGSYLKETASRSNTVEILVKVHYETATLTIPSTILPLLEIWDKKDTMGTHYARSITYGGDLVASLKFKAQNSRDRERIKAAVEGSLQGGSFGLELKGQFEKLEKDLQETTSMDIHYYASVPLKTVPKTVEDLMELVDSFPEQAKAVNEGLGVPLRMELVPLTALKADTSTFFKNTAINDQLDRFEAELDDLQAAKRALNEWMANVPPILPSEWRNKIGEFNTELERVVSVFYEVIGNLDISTSGAASQFDSAFEAYKGDGSLIPEKYNRRFIKLKDEIIANVPDLKMDVGGGTYLHWGKNGCGRNDVEEVFRGVSVTSDEAQGSGYNILCFPSDPNWPENEVSVSGDASHLEPLGYNFQTLSSRNGNVACTLCRMTNRVAPTVFPGVTKCPNDAWTLEYSGHLAAPNVMSRKRDFLCVDEKRDVAETTSIDKLGRNQPQVSEVSLMAECESHSCGNWVENKVIPCVVCSF
ncbi:uncharacterized protein LOC106463692 [Limulus polyphemus]|uniref:Uncharacterized protein LOC106463692 n=1 Tax=Limulus polyphemus TaxID=6850 RepID=A0ABM1STM6_LIMPO|nr:uncharacterized protein LOC106463692 [Limulus polyphemus]